MQDLENGEDESALLNVPAVPSQSAVAYVSAEPYESYLVMLHTGQLLMA